jgi:hypothetical protein
MNGMMPDDVAIVADTDEAFTRDFLRALQICDVPAFRNDQNCHMAKLTSSSMVFESSSECITKGRRWWHPNAVIGACVDQIGDSDLHPVAIREWTKGDKNESGTNSIKLKSSHGCRQKGYGQGGNYSLANYSITGNYPLWSGEDIRTAWGEVKVASRSPTAYHFHNFFDSANDIHFKYHTYGHSVREAMDTPIWEM